MKAPLAAILLPLAIPAFAADLSGYLRETDALMLRGRNPEALERLAWFHEHALEEDPAMYAVRLTTALDTWKRLADRYPPAKLALDRTLERKDRRVRETGGSRNLFADVVAIHRVLGEPARSVETFRVVDQNHPPLAKKYWDLVEEAALQAEDLALAARYVPDVMAKFEKDLDARDRTVKAAKRRGLDELAKASDQAFARRARTWARLALAKEDRDTALEIQKQALQRLEDPADRALLTDGLPAPVEVLPPAPDPPEGAPGP